MTIASPTYGLLRLADDETVGNEKDKFSFYVLFSPSIVGSLKRNFILSFHANIRMHV